MPGPAPLAKQLAARIAAEGPMPLSAYMAVCNAHYYATRDPLGVAGDFITAPEISQMFGELIGLCLADTWQRAGSPPDAIWVELGPGRGTLTRDALRAATKAGFTPAVHLVETSPALRAAQAGLLPDAIWHDGIDSLPDDRPLLIVANEFFDALPIRQLVREDGAWGERVVNHVEGRFVPAIIRLESVTVVPPDWEADGTVLEASPAALSVMQALGGRLGNQGGAMLVADYGHVRTAPGETLQAVRGHAHASPWNDPGEQDLTAHVDFAALSAAAARVGGRVHGPVEQGEFLTALGIAHRAAALTRVAPARADEIAVQHRRLTDPDQMGRLFKVMAVTGAGWPVPAGLPA